MTKKKYRNALPPGYRLGWYNIEKVLGQGGFGITYLATNVNLNRAEALKEYLPREIAARQPDHRMATSSADDQAPFRHGLKGFVAEARTLARLKHPNIVQVHNVFEANGTAYMAMEYERGVSLEAAIKRGEYADEATLKALLEPLLDALDYMHQRQFIHRDIKPTNILIRADGLPVLLDFGSARAALSEETHTLTALVSQGYAPFEQYHSEKGSQGAWTDIYALAATAYRAILGHAPKDAVVRGNARIDDKPDPLVPALTASSHGFSETFLRAIDSGLALKAAQRPQSVAEWRTLFDAQPMAPRDNGDGDGDTRPTVAWSRAKWSLVAALVLAIAGAGGWYAFRQDLLPREPEPEPASPTVAADEELAALEAERRRVEAEFAEIKARARSVAELLIMAELAVSEQRYTQPLDDNALAHYQAAERLDPGNAGVQTGLARLLSALTAHTGKALGGNDFPAAERWLEQARDVDRDSPEVAALQERLTQAVSEARMAEQTRETEFQRLRRAEAARRAAAKAQQETQDPPEQAAQTTKAEEEPTADTPTPQPQPPDQARQATITDLVNKAKAALTAMRLTKPAGDNALEYYRALAELDPEHADIRTGIESIVRRYIELAEKSQRRGNFAKAAAYLDRAEDVEPWSDALGAAREQLAAAEAEHLERERRREDEAARLAEAAAAEAAAAEAAEAAEAAAAAERAKRRATETTSPETDAQSGGGADIPVPDMVAVAGGCFYMGSRDKEQGRKDNERRHWVCVEDFSLGRHEVTVRQFRRFVAASGHATDAERNLGKDGCLAYNPGDAGKQWKYRASTNWRQPNPYQANEERHPVSCVSWNDARAYIDWLNRETRTTYRLPTEAEWEYAARAKTTTARFWGDDPRDACEYANITDLTTQAGHSWSERHECKDGHYFVAPVGRYRANSFGLHDMLGNVWEWTCSAFDKGYDGDETRCVGRVAGGARVLRGGSWGYGPARARSAARSRNGAIARFSDLGFRLARSK